MNVYKNLSTEDIDIEMTDYKPTDKLQLIFDGLNFTIELIMTKEQLQQLRTAIEYTPEEAKELEDWMEKEHKK